MYLLEAVADSSALLHLHPCPCCQRDTRKRLLFAVFCLPASLFPSGGESWMILCSFSVKEKKRESASVKVYGGLYVSQIILYFLLVIKASFIAFCVP